jgi:outer membrane protein, heavy metal efflux system
MKAFAPVSVLFVLLSSGAFAAVEPPTFSGPSAKLEFNDTPSTNLKPYNIDDLSELAKNHNPTIVQARAQIRGEAGKALQAGLWPNPAVGYVGDLMGLPNAGAGEFQGGMVGQDVILGGKLKYSRKKYQARVSAAEQEAIAQEYRVRNDVHVAFYHALAAAEVLNLQRELLKTAKDHWLTAHEMFNVGQSNQVDLYDADITLEMQKANVIKSSNDLMLAWQNLTTVVGVDEDYRPVKGNLEEVQTNPTWNETLEHLLKESPELAEAKDKLRSDEIMVQREHRQPIPNVTLCGGAGYDQLDRAFAARAAFNVTNIPLFNRNQGTIQQAEADLERQKAQVRLVELNLRRRLAFQYTRFKTELAYVEAFKNVIVPESRSKYEVRLKSYMEARLDWPDVLKSQHQYVDARVEYIDHLVECKEASLEIDGLLLTGGLIAPPGVTPPGHIDAVAQPR